MHPENNFDTHAGTVTVENTGLSGVVVRLSGVSDASATTDASGRYSFTGLRMGNYSVEISGFDSDAVGFSSTASSTSVGVGESKIVSFDGTYLRTAGVSGQVSVEGEGLNGVMVSLRGGPDNVDESTTTDAAGQYAFASLRAGTYTVGISGWDDTDFEFEVTSKSVTVALGETGYVEFEGELLRTSGLAGRVSVGGMGMAGITVTLSGTADATANTDASGIYAFAGLAAGDYTVTISGYDAVEYSFDDSQTVTLEMDKTAIVNFDGMALRTASVKVMVTADGGGVAGVAATLTLVTSLNPPSGTIVGAGATDADGMHTFGPLLAGNYRVDISGADDEIDFADGMSWQGPVATDGMAEANFAGTINRTGSIAGMVTADGEGMGGVTVTLGGAGDASAMTADDGSYGFTGLRRGDYTVSVTNPNADMYSFPTTSRAVSVAIGQMHSDVSFAGTMIRRSSISGQVSVEGMGLEGVAVMLSGAHEATDTTDASGQYAFAGLGSGTYTVSMANPDDVAYTFETMSADIELGNSGSATQNFTGTHTRTASISGMLYVDEADKNDMYDEGEDMLSAADVELSLVGPSVGMTQSASTDSTGAFSFGELQAGNYQLTVARNAEFPMDYDYGGDAAGYSLEVAAGGEAMQNIPVDITHQTVAFSVTLRAGDDTGPAVEGAMVNLYADEDDDDMVGSGMTDDMGMASIRFARADTEGHMVYAAVMAPEGDYAVADGMQMVSWDGKDKMASAANSGNIVNLAAHVAFGGATRMTEYGGGKALAGWGVDVLMTGDDDKKAVVEGAPTKLDDDGMAAFMTTAESADDLPMTYYFALDADQDDDMDGGEKYMGDTLMYTHTGLTMGAQDAGTITATYTTQKLQVYIHHERDQIMGYTGNVLGGDVRPMNDGKVSTNPLMITLEYIAANGRARAFPTTAKVGDTDSDGVVTFTNVPADHDVIVRARAKDEDANIMLVGARELAAYEALEGNGVMGGAFGDMGGFHHTVELCPLTSEEHRQGGGECSSFAYVNTYTVEGLVWKTSHTKTSTGGFKPKDPTFVDGITVGLTTVEGKNLVGEDESHTTTKAPVRNGREGVATSDWDDELDETHQFRFTDVAAGVYKLNIPSGWQVKTNADADNLMAVKGASGGASAAVDPLGGDVRLDVTPTTGYVYGFVKKSDGFPAVGATVTANGVPATTDQFGRYIIDGVTGTRISNEAKNHVVVEAAMNGASDKTDPMAFVRNGPIGGRNVDLTVGSATETASISGTVTMNGEPVAGAKIEVDGNAPNNKNKRSPGSPTDNIYVTDADGSYMVVVNAKPAGTNVKVTATKTGLTVLPTEGIQVPALAKSSISGINFVAYGNATITGRVKASAGGPMAGVTVTATSTAAGTTEPADTHVTNSTGTFSLSVPSGSFTVEAKRTGYNFSNPKNPSGLVSTGPGQTVSFGDFEAAGNSQPVNVEAERTSTIPDNATTTDIDESKQSTDQITVTWDPGTGTVADSTTYTVWRKIGTGEWTDAYATVTGHSGTFTADDAENDGVVMVQVRATYSNPDAGDDVVSMSDAAPVKAVDPTASGVTAKRNTDPEPDQLVVTWTSATATNARSNYDVEIEFADGDGDFATEFTAAASISGEGTNAGKVASWTLTVASDGTQDGKLRVRVVTWQGDGSATDKTRKTSAVVVVAAK